MKRIINESEFNRNFASNIRFLRESYELTQWQVAKILGYERSAYSYIELGKTSAKIYVAYQLSRIFQVPLTPLLTCHYLDWKNIFPISEQISAQNPNIKMLNAIMRYMSEIELKMLMEYAIKILSEK